MSVLVRLNLSAGDDTPSWLGVGVTVVVTWSDMICQDQQVIDGGNLPKSDDSLSTITMTFFF